LCRYRRQDAAGDAVAEIANDERRSPMMQNPSSRKAAILANSERIAADREKFWQRAAFFHEEDLRYLRFLIPEGLRVLEIGCGTGNVLAGLKPSFGLGVDFSPAMI
jgi:SAM-dependent methyltransferase